MHGKTTIKINDMLIFNHLQHGGQYLTVSSLPISGVMVLLEINLKCLKFARSFVMWHKNQEAKAATPCTHLCKTCERGAPWSDMGLPENLISVNCGKGVWLLLCAVIWLVVRNIATADCQESNSSSLTPSNADKRSITHRSV